MNIAYLHFGKWGGPYRTYMAEGVHVDEKVPRNPYAEGYGRKIPTCYSVLYAGRWRRVYCTQYSNNGTLWVNVRGEEIVVSLEIDT